MAAASTCFPGAPEMVAVAADRVPIAVASSAPRRLIAAVLEATGLAPHFSAFVSSEEVPRGKPSPDVYLEAARQIGVPPASCAAVEDSSNGIRAAAAAGMTVIAIPNSVYPPRPDAWRFVRRSPHRQRRCAAFSSSGYPNRSPSRNRRPGDRFRGGEEQRTMKRMLNEASAFREEMIAGTPAPTGGTFSASLAHPG